MSCGLAYAHLGLAALSALVCWPRVLVRALRAHLHLFTLVLAGLVLVQGCGTGLTWLALLSPLHFRSISLTLNLSFPSAPLSSAALSLTLGRGCPHLIVLNCAPVGSPVTCHCHLVLLNH
jgi:hypothetical protein